MTGSTGTLLLELLESRLDCVIYRLGFASTIPAARQIINHGHILVNNKLVNIPSFICEIGDTFSIKERSQSKKLIESNFETQQQKRKLIQRRMKRVNLTKSRFHSLLPSHLEINNEKFIGKLSNYCVRLYSCILTSLVIWLFENLTIDIETLDIVNIMC